MEKWYISFPALGLRAAYFKKFRQKFLDEGALEHIHLFVSRDKVFEKESVLLRNHHYQGEKGKKQTSKCHNNDYTK